jgi:hypothetical protein
MHLKVFVKLKKTLKTLSSGQKKTKKNPKKTKKPKKPKKPKNPKKNPKKTKKPKKKPKKHSGLGLKKKKSVFSNPVRIRMVPLLNLNGGDLFGLDFILKMICGS